MNKLFYATMAVTLFLQSSCKKSGGGDAPADTKQAGIAALDSKVTSFMGTYNIPGAQGGSNHQRKSICICDAGPDVRYGKEQHKQLAGY